MWLNFPHIWSSDWLYKAKILHIKHHLTADTDEDPHSPYRFSIKDYIFETNEIYKLNNKDLLNYGLRFKVKKNQFEPNDTLSKFLFANKNLGLILTTIFWTFLIGWYAIFIWIFYKYCFLLYTKIFIDMNWHKGFGYKHPDDNSKAVQKKPWIFIDGLHSTHHANPNVVNTKYRWFEIDFFYLQLKLLEMFKAIKLKR
jgi:fatty-acid desaturase